MRSNWMCLLLNTTSQSSVENNDCFFWAEVKEVTYGWIFGCLVSEDH